MRASCLASLGNYIRHRRESIILKAFGWVCLECEVISEISYEASASVVPVEITKTWKRQGQRTWRKGGRHQNGHWEAGRAGKKEESKGSEVLNLSTQKSGDAII